MTVKYENGVTPIAESEGLPNLKVMWHTLDESHIMVTKQTKESVLRGERFEQLIDTLPTVHDLWQRESLQLLDVPIEYQRVPVLEIVAVKHLLKKRGIRLEVIRATAVTEVEIAEYDHSRRPIQRLFRRSVKEIGQILEAELILHYG